VTINIETNDDASLAEDWSNLYVSFQGYNKT